MEKVTSCKATVLLVVIWFAVYVLSKATSIDVILCSKGINNIGNQYWRFLTAGFVQNNMIHVFGNIYLIIWLGMRYENIIGSSRFFILGFVGSAIAYFVFCFIYKNATYSIGGSGYWYALVGYILIQQLRAPEFAIIGQRWMLVYAFVLLPVIPIIPGMNMSTAVFHSIALAAGVVLGSIRM